MGFDGLFFARADYQDILARNSTKKREMIWKASANLGSASYLFTGILPNGYGAPGSFCYDYHCADPPIMVSRNRLFFCIWLIRFICYRITNVYMITMLTNEFRHFSMLPNLRYRFLFKRMFVFGLILGS